MLKDRSNLAIFVACSALLLAGVAMYSDSNKASCECKETPCKCVDGKCVDGGVCPKEPVKSLYAESEVDGRLGGGLHGDDRIPRHERVVELPEDGNAWHTIVILNDSKNPDQGSKRLKALLENQRVREIVAQTHRHDWDNRSQLFDKKYRQYIGNALPAFVLQTHLGKVIYRTAGDDQPASGDLMADELERAIEQYKADCDCNRKPKPSPAPKPDVVKPSSDQLGTTPVVRPKTEEAMGNLGGPLMVAAFSLVSLLVKRKFGFGV